MPFADFNEDHTSTLNEPKSGALVGLLIKFGMARTAGEARKILLIAAIGIVLMAVAVFFIGKAEPAAKPLPYEATYENTY